MNIGMFQGLDDINDDNTATVWWFKVSPQPNEELICSDITKMCTAEELLELIRGSSVQIGNNRIWGFCKEKDESRRS